MLPQTIEEFKKHFPNTFITNKFKVYVRKKIFKTHYMFFDTKDNKAGRCSYCETTSIINEKTKHNEFIKCPHCGTELQVKHVWRGLRYMRDKAIVYTFSNSIQDKSILIGACIYAERFTEEDINDIYFGTATALYLFVPNIGAIMANRKYYFDIDDWDYSLSKGVNPVHINTPFWGESKYTIGADLNSLNKSIKNTQFKYSCYEKYLDAGEGIIRYLAAYTKRPMLEYLSKLGFKDFLIDYYYKGGTNSNKLINWRGKKIERIFRFKPCKSDIKYLQTHEPKAEYIAFWLNENQKGRQINIKDIVENNWKYTYHVRNIESIFPDINIFKYFNRQKEKGIYTDANNFIADFDDYLRICMDLDLNMTDKQVIYPSNLHESHTYQITRRRNIKNQALNSLINERVKPLYKKYTFTYKGACIIVPRNVKDFAIEGAQMRNCVAGYASRHAKKHTDIVFVRKMKDINKSYLTMEIVNNKIVQCRSERNQQPDDFGNEFINIFIEKVLNKTQKFMSLAS